MGYWFVPCNEHYKSISIISIRRSCILSIILQSIALCYQCRKSRYIDRWLLSNTKEISPSKQFAVVFILGCVYTYVCVYVVALWFIANFVNLQLMIMPTHQFQWAHVSNGKSIDNWLKCINSQNATHMKGPLIAHDVNNITATAIETPTTSQIGRICIEPKA